MPAHAGVAWRVVLVEVENAHCCCGAGPPTSLLAAGFSNFIDVSKQSLSCLFVNCFQAQLIGNSWPAKQDERGTHFPTEKDKTTKGSWWTTQDKSEAHFPRKILRGGPRNLGQ